MSSDGGTLHTATFRASDGAELGIYRAGVARGAGQPGLVVFPSIFGVTRELREHADEISRTGALVLAFDPFSRSQDPGGVEEADRERAMKRVSGLDFRRVNRDFRELLKALAADPACNGRVVGLGICLGGPFVWNAACDGLLHGVAAWHGSRMGSVIDRASQIRCPVILDFGADDPVVPPEELERIEAACQVIPELELRVHPGAGHGFSHTGWSEHRSEVMAVARGSLEKLLSRLRS